MSQKPDNLATDLDPEVLRGLEAAATLGRNMQRVDRKFMGLVVRERVKLLAALIGLITTATSLTQGVHIELAEAGIGEAQAAVSYPDFQLAVRFLEEKIAAATLVLQEAGVEVKAGTLYPPQEVHFQVVAESKEPA